MNNEVGVYKISLVAFPKNRILYVGQSKYLSDRIRNHKYELKKNTHRNPHLQNVFNKYNLSSMRFEILEECLISKLDEIEQRYIDELAPECNIVRDVKNRYDKFQHRESTMLDFDLPGLELDWSPQPWHVWVYGCGRHGI